MSRNPNFVKAMGCCLGRAPDDNLVISWPDHVCEPVRFTPTVRDDQRLLNWAWGIVTSSGGNVFTPTPTRSNSGGDAPTPTRWTTVDGLLVVEVLNDRHEVLSYWRTQAYGPIKGELVQTHVVSRGHPYSIRLHILCGPLEEAEKKKKESILTQ